MAAPTETVVYNNTYYSPESTTIAEPPIDYSQPLPLPEVPAESTAEGEEPPPDPAVQSAIAIFDEGRAAFAKRDYAKALAKVDEAIKKLPSDATLNEFRALTLFAMKKYQEAAATIYAVLAAGPGWSWDTVRELYGNPDDYTSDLRALEAFVKKNPDAAYGHLLLGYHYLVINAQDIAIREFERVTKLQPEDKVSAELLKALKQGSSSDAAPRPGGP